MKRQLSEWKKIFAKETSNKGLISLVIQTVHAAQCKKRKKNLKIGRP